MAIQVFISYKSEYRDFARAVKRQLNQWGYNTWLDVDNIQPGDYFRHKIQQGLDSSDVLLMVLTEEAQLSREVMSEVDYFLDVAKKPVVPLRHRECKPLYIFVSIQYIDFVSNQDNGFLQLKQRLTELASTIPQTGITPEEIVVAPQTPGAASLLDAVGEASDLVSEEQHLSGEVAHAPTVKEESSLADTGQQAPVDDFLKADIPAEAPKPQPAPPASMNLPVPPSAPPMQPVTAPYQAERQQPMAQPAAVGRKSRSPILWSLAAVASLVIVVGAVVLLNNSPTISSSAPSQPQGTSPLAWVVVVGVIGAAGIIGWRRFGGTNARESLRPSPTQEAANRATMLQKVDDFWLKGVLDPALEAGTLDIGLSSAPGAVLRHKDYGDYELPPNANILDVFNDLNRELLILGAPGGGKTVLLLQLARELINQAKHPHPSIPSPSGRGEEPIPVVFNLSSWAAERKPLADWLVDELRQKYQVPKNVATAWVEGEKLLLLLDGLDEVAEQYRNDCVDAINNYRQTYRTVDLAICSRALDYDALTSRLDVRGAIVLEPLNQPIIDRYLNRPELASLREVIATDTELQEMSRVPFLLNAMAYAYAGSTTTNLEFPKSSDLAKARRTHLFDRWVEKRLAARPSEHYQTSQIRIWLEWLAKKLVLFKKVVFYIENLQPEWLTGNRLIYQFTSKILLGLLSGITIGLTLALPFGLPVGSAAGIVFGLIIAFGEMNITLAERLRWRLKSRVYAAGLIGGVAGGFAGSISNSAFGGIIGVLGGGLIGILAGGMDIQETLLHRTLPNEGIKRSFYNAVRLSLIVFFIVVITGVSIIGVEKGLAINIEGGFGLGLTAGLIFGGGDSVLKHLLLRLILWQRGYAPWNYARFLDYCASAGLMRKVGGGYIFAHRYLMEYFVEIPHPPAPSP